MLELNEEDRKRILQALAEMFRRNEVPPPRDFWKNTITKGDGGARESTVLPEMYRQEFPIELVIFDLDGTLTETRSGETFPRDAADRTPRRHVQKQIDKLQLDGVKVAVATNQGGIANGHYDAYILRATIQEQLYAWFDIASQNVAICPHHPNGTVLEFARECVCRKPSPYMLLHLMDYHSIAPSHTLFVGDMDSDEEAARRAGCHFIWASNYFYSREWR